MYGGSFTTPQPCTAVHRNQGSRSLEGENFSGREWRTATLRVRELDARGDSRRADIVHSARRSLWSKPASLSFRRRRRRGRVLLAELVDAAAGVHNFLLARIEGMA